MRSTSRIYTRTTSDRGLIVNLIDFSPMTTESTIDCLRLPQENCWRMHFGTSLPSEWSRERSQCSNVYSTTIIHCDELAATVAPRVQLCIRGTTRGVGPIAECSRSAAVLDTRNELHNRVLVRPCRVRNRCVARSKIILARQVIPFDRSRRDLPRIIDDQACRNIVDKFLIAIDRNRDKKTRGKNSR